MTKRFTFMFWAFVVIVSLQIFHFRLSDAKVTFFFQTQTNNSILSQKYLRNSDFQLQTLTFLDTLNRKQAVYKKWSCLLSFGEISLSLHHLKKISALSKQKTRNTYYIMTTFYQQ